MKNEALQTQIKKTVANTAKVLALYFAKEPNITAATRAVLLHNQITEQGYLKVIKEQAAIFEQLEAAYMQMQQLYNTEKARPKHFVGQN